MTIKILATDYDGDELIAHPIVNNIIRINQADIKKIQEQLRDELQRPATHRYFAVMRNGKCCLLTYKDIKETERIYFSFPYFPTEREMFIALQTHIADDDEIAKAWRPYAKVE